MAHTMTNIIRACDTECYGNYWLCKFRDHTTGTLTSISMSPGRPLNIIALRLMLAGCTVWTFNGKAYDLLMISAAITGRFDNDMLMRLSNYIINSREQPWVIAREWGIELLEFDHIDWMPVAPGQASLKTYAARLHAAELQDLPYPVGAMLTPEQMIEVDRYCGKDLVNTTMIGDALEDEMSTRVELSAQYGVDMRSRSDAQIAEDAFKKLLPFKVERRHIQPGYRFQYQPAPWLSFQTPEMQEAFRRCCTAWFVIPESGKPQLPPELDDYAVRLGGMIYRMGNGGLHSSEEKITHRAGPNVELVDIDFDSFYPKIISMLKMYPEQIGPIFLTIFDGWIEVRLTYKREGQKKKSATFKIKINGTFGKLGSKYSILYAPELLIRTTLTGQLTLLMMIERMHLAGIEIIQANTDGIVTKCHPSQAAARDAIVREVERITGMTTEATRYAAVFSRDVNNYLAAKPNKDGSIEFKAKGTYASEGLAKNPTAAICVDAVKEYLLRGTPIASTIRNCQDIRQFLTVRNVKGGGEWVHDSVDDSRVGTKREALRAAGWTSIDEKGTLWRPKRGIHEAWDMAIDTDAAIKQLISGLPRTYLGKVVRWYYGHGQRGYIAAVSKGTRVAKSDGCKPCMDLPPTFPHDVDYERYEREATEMLHDLGVH
jgi:hypothetical protein